MRIHIIFVLLLLCVNSYSQIKYGKNSFITKVDGVDRNYVMHVPLSYDASKAVPLVFMLHGTSGSGDDFYQNIGWKELSERENFIVVYPSSLRYKIIDAEGPKITTKWNTPPDASFIFQPGEVGKDDIKFLRKVIDEVSEKFRIDNKRIYLNGFSNGGNMAAKCAIEMSDVLAAVCQNASSFHLDTVYIPKRKIPLLYQVGNKDYGPGNDGPSIPMNLFDSLISTPNLAYLMGKFYNIANLTQKHFELESSFTMEGDSNLALVATFLPKANTGGYEYKYILVKNLAHNYPNGVFHPFDAPKIHWNWMKQYTLDNSTTSSHKLTIHDGYGTGNFEKDQLVHIWAEQKDDKVFTHWSGDIQYLESPKEYHTRVIMPNQNVEVTANFTTLLPNMEMKLLTIKGAVRDKKIFAYLPTDNNKIKGLVWFFHGTNGNALNMISDPDTRQMINLLMVNDYGVIALTSEESEYDIDFDKDGFFRYSYGLDTNLVDIANVRAIRDSLINRNLLNKSTPHAAIGWSAGGAFSEFIANSLGWKAAINHTSPGSSVLSLNDNIKVPYLAAVNENDTNPGVGKEGNEQAAMNVQNYKNRSACAILHTQKKAPLYPERFDRSDFINDTLSKAIFEEIKKNNGLDNDNYVVGLYGDLAQLVIRNPAKFPTIIGLSQRQKEAVQKQIEVSNAEHSLKADINNMSLDFIEKACDGLVPVHNFAIEDLFFYPNPASTSISFKEVSAYFIYDINGKLILQGNGKDVSIEGLRQGMHIVKSGNKVGILVVSW